MQHDPFGIAGTVQARVFRVQGAVAEGGFGVVYRAFHDVFRSDVALKCLKVPDTLTPAQRPAFLERFRSEAELLFRLSAALPEVVRPLQFGVLEAKQFVPFLALEWLEGETLDRFVSNRTDQGKPPLSLTAALELLTPIARVLSRAHHFNDKGEQMAIIHSDIKPENVFLATVHGERVVKILDFGIARVKAETNAIAGRATSQDSVAAFSPAYAAPEQWHPASFGGTGPWTDVYGLALTLTEVLIGKAPITGDLTSLMGAALAPDWRPTPRTKGAKISDAAEKAFERALAVDPRVRTQSVEAFWTQLDLSIGRSASITRRNVVDEALLGSIPPPPNLELELPVPAPPKPRAAEAPMLQPIQMAPSTPFDDFDAPAGRLDLDVAPKPRSSAPQRSRPAPISNAWSPPPPPSRTLGERFRGPAWLAFFAVAIGAADVIMLKMTGERLMLGPLRPLYVAGPLAVLAFIMTVMRALEE